MRWGGGGVPACARTTGGGRRGWVPAPMFTRAGSSREQRKGWALRCVRNDIWLWAGTGNHKGRPYGSRRGGRGMGPRMREDNGRGTKGMGSCSHVHEGRLFMGKTGGVDAAFGMTFRSGRGRATTRVAPTGAEGRGGRWVPACARTTGGGRRGWVPAPMFTRAGSSREQRKGWALRCVRNDISQWAGTGDHKGRPYGGRREGRGMGPRMREDNGAEAECPDGDVPHGSPHARGHGRGTKGDGFLLPCSRGQALRGKNGWGGRCVRNDIWEKGMALEGEGGFETRPYVLLTTWASKVSWKATFIVITRTVRIDWV